MMREEAPYDGDESEDWRSRDGRDIDIHSMFDLLLIDEK